MVKWFLDEKFLEVQIFLGLQNFMLTWNKIFITFVRIFKQLFTLEY